MADSRPRWLDIGSGYLTEQIKADGWITLDADAQYNPDICVTVPPLIDKSLWRNWEKIRAIHFLEHLQYDEALQFIREVKEILAFGGELIIEVPNIVYMAQVVAGVIDVSKELDPHFLGLHTIYGTPELTKDNIWQQHKWGWTPKTLTGAMVECGFDLANVTLQPAKFHRPERDFRIVAYNL